MYYMTNGVLQFIDKNLYKWKKNNYLNMYSPYDQ